MTNHPIFLKLDVNFIDHPQTLALSDSAKVALIRLWSYCKRHNTDGRVPRAIYEQLHYKTRNQLSKHYVKDDQSDGQSDVYMTGYLEHQTSAAQAAELGKRRAEYGRKGGFAKQNPGYLEVEVDQEVEPVSKDTGRAARKRASSLPADFVVTELMEAWARKECPGVDTNWETKKFRDYHESKGSTFKDWPAAWRTWMRRATPAAPQGATEAKKDWWFNS